MANTVDAPLCRNQKRMEDDDKEARRLNQQIWGDVDAKRRGELI